MNRFIGWTSLVAGIATGLVMGLWSFDGPAPVPGWLGDYDDLSRRLARLGHIAFIGLGILNILLSRELTALALGPGARRIAAAAMNVGNVLLPLALLAAAAWHPAKYATAVPALCVFVAMGLAAWGARPGSGNLEGRP